MPKQQNNYRGLNRHLSTPDINSKMLLDVESEFFGLFLKGSVHSRNKIKTTVVVLAKNSVPMSVSGFTHHLSGNLT